MIPRCLVTVPPRRCTAPATASAAPGTPRTMTASVAADVAAPAALVLNPGSPARGAARRAAARAAAAIRLVLPVPPPSHSMPTAHVMLFTAAPVHNSSTSYRARALSRHDHPA